MKKYICRVLTGSLVFFGAISYEAHAGTKITNLAVLVQAEASIIDSIGFEKNAIERHRCMDHEQLVNDMHSVFFFRESVKANVPHDGYSITENDFSSIVSQYTRDQIIAAEVVALSHMVPEQYVGGRAGDWLDHVNAAQRDGDIALEGALLAVAPGIVFDTFAEIAKAGPFYLMDQAFNAMDRSRCTPIADVEARKF